MSYRIHLCLCNFFFWAMIRASKSFIQNFFFLAKNAVLVQPKYLAHMCSFQQIVLVKMKEEKNSEVLKQTVSAFPKCNIQILAASHKRIQVLFTKLEEVIVTLPPYTQQLSGQGIHLGCGRSWFEYPLWSSDLNAGLPAPR